VNRIQWFKAFWKSPKILKQRILASQYTSVRGEGFILNSSSQYSLSGRYVNSNVIIEEIRDPFGRIEISERKNFEYIDFVFSGKSFQLIEITNPGRCVRKFVAAISQLDDFGVTVEKFEISAIEFLRTLEVLGVSVLFAKQLELSDIGISENVSGKMSLKGRIDFKNYTEDLNLPSEHCLTKLLVVAKFLDFSGDIELSNCARIKMSKTLSPILIPIISEFMLTKV
jgi:hypothetical protein